MTAQWYVSTESVEGLTVQWRANTPTRVVPFAGIFRFAQNDWRIWPPGRHFNPDAAEDGHSREYARAGCDPEIYPSLKAAEAAYLLIYGDK